MPLRLLTLAEGLTAVIQQYHPTESAIEEMKSLPLNLLDEEFREPTLHEKRDAS